MDNLVRRDLSGGSGKEDDKTKSEKISGINASQCFRIWITGKRNSGFLFDVIICILCHYHLVKLGLNDLLNVEFSNNNILRGMHSAYFFSPHRGVHYVTPLQVM